MTNFCSECGEEIPDKDEVMNWKCENCGDIMKK